MPRPRGPSPEEIFSDDSSFYGSDQELEQEAAEYDPRFYWSFVHPKLLSTIQARNQEQEREKQAELERSKRKNKIKEKKDKMSPTPMDIDNNADDMKMDLDTHDDTEGTPGSLPRNKAGSNETSTAFLHRLPPSTTQASSIGPWIYIHTESLKRLNEDVATFTKRGWEALHAFDEKEASLRYENDRKGGSSIALARKVKPLERELESHIFALARETGCVTGKWMMFITPDRIDHYWGAVAEATIAGHLGIGAKVATDAGEGDRARLIAIYTRDYDDKDDVKRVLRKLAEMNLVKRGERPIYYKRDALTYLEIMSKNKYGIKATAFSSADVLGGKI
ncbi:DUF1917 domain-containing protein [Aspergillus stella-maris]|uniref:DUF1917 domain-containing protein n=1 Tax=Aspergillus stella-maris TaxID=1810926 RepID=UPI003CCCE243